MEIDLSGHENPAEFVKEVEKKYPDEEVTFELKGNIVIVSFSDKVPTQQRLNVGDFLSLRAKEQIYPPFQR